MTLFIRTIQVILRSFFLPRLHLPDAEGRVCFRVLPTDLDQNWHMNNARYLNYMEASRHDLQIRLGFFMLALKKGWYAPIKGIEIEFLRPLKLFQRFEVSARIVKATHSELWVYQEITSNGKTIARALVRTLIKKGRETIPPGIYLQPLNASENEIFPPQSIQAWIESRERLHLQK
jgi:YbgC/YbaW family acyl-CoA thioester hydrolase